MLTADGLCSESFDDAGFATQHGEAPAWLMPHADVHPPPDGAKQTQHPSADDCEVPGQRTRRIKACDLLELMHCMHAIVKRDERALQALYVASAQRVYSSVLRVVRQAALAEEVVMDTYFQVWLQAARYDATRGHVLGWMLTIARSRAIDAMRHQARFQHLPIAEDTVLSDDALWPDDTVRATGSHPRLQCALMALQAQPRQLVALAYFRGLTHEEIARQTRLPLGTVKSQLRRALFSLHQTLRPAAGTPTV